MMSHNPRRFTPGDLLVGFAVVATTVFLVPRTASAAIIGEWSFDNDFSDTSGNGNNLSTAGTGTVNIVPGQFGNAAEFDGDSFLWSGAAAMVADQTQFSMGAWFKANGSQGPDALILGSLFPTFQSGITYHNGATLFSYVNNGPNNANAPLANDSEWHFVAQTFDGSTIRLYLDGLLAASTASTATSTGSNSEFSFGGRSILANTFVGLIDEGFFRDDVLSDSQIAQLAVVPEPSTLVLALWSAVALVAFRRRRGK